MCQAFVAIDFLYTVKQIFFVRFIDIYIRKIVKYSIVEKYVK